MPTNSHFGRMKHLGAIVAAAAVAAGSIVPAAAQELEEIIVTARKIEESLQEAPVAVSVVTGDTLARMGSQDLTAVGQYAPNVIFETGQSTSGIRSPTIYIRGVGQPDFIIVEDPAIGVYLDGVYVGRTIGSVFDLVDVNRVEVLRGPQGTLFGRNTIGGAINLISKRPDPEAVDARVKVGLGENGYQSAQGVINVPLGQTAAARFSAHGHKQDGYVKALQYDDYDIGGEDVWGFRAALSFDPTESFSVDFAFDYSADSSAPNAVSPINFLHLDGKPRPVTTFGTWWNVFHSGNPGVCANPATAPSSPACFSSYYHPNDPYATHSVFVDNDGNQIEPNQKLDVWGAHLNLSLDLGWGQLTSITAIREFEVTLHNDIDFTPFIIFANNHDDYSQDQFSQELQLSGTAFDDRLDFLVGLFYFEEDGVEDIFNQLAFPRAVAPAFYFQTVTRYVDNTSKAAFTQLNYDLTDSLRLTLGMRYTESEKDFNLVQPNILGAMVDNTGHLKVEEWTPMATLSWTYSDAAMFYLTYSEGFRDGGFPARFVGRVPEPLPFYDPEYMENYEIGAKFLMADNRIRLNLAAFRMDYTDIQVTAIAPFGSIGDSTTKDNLGKVKMSGLEAELTAAVTADLVVNVTLGILDDEIESVVGGLLRSGSFDITRDNDLPMTPEISGTIGGEYTYNLDSAGRIVVRADYSFKDDYYTRVENAVETLEKNYRSLNASVRWVSADDRWEVGVWGRNLTDELYYRSRVIFESIGSAFGTPTRPRMVYASVQYRFGG